MRSHEYSSVLQIDHGQCVGCAICVDVCPEAALAMGPGDLRPTCLADGCTACGKCVYECPTAAITLGSEVAVRVA
jgi:formate hydrogenlyase subunit 6/NADH:ubiquinone oxidoreductase subunit I